jgi:hypothetical protein
VVNGECATLWLESESAKATIECDSDSKVSWKVASLDVAFTKHIIIHFITCYHRDRDNFCKSTACHHSFMIKIDELVKE